ncbi:uncharacterized protein LOC112082804 [Eutrema salsugineum]|uniref:uncharacterized protein LOC112082804 n=1 Tax=Eutrema salsugineum TaxID=72664 RepID=UPI000CED43BE|nr:uncharacterized protein LOC112082804 [Eutrema salsugineum]
MGRLIDVVGMSGIISLGVSAYASVASVWHTHRRMRHRTAVLNSIEDEIWRAHSLHTTGEDQALWKAGDNRFLPKFSSKKTWHNIRVVADQKSWVSAVWFTGTTPKCAFITWLAALNRLTTGEQMLQWNRGVSASCVYCSIPVETRSHLFFECSFSQQIWDDLARGLLGTRHTRNWDEVIEILSSNSLESNNLIPCEICFPNFHHLDLEGTQSKKT